MMKILSIKSIDNLAVGLVLLFALFLSASCEKEGIDEVAPAQTSSDDVTFRDMGDGVVDYSLAEDILLAINYDEIIVDGELQSLSFPSEEVLGSTLDLIEEANEVLDLEIANSILGLSEEEIDLMGINDYFAFEFFEGHFPGFQSHRAEKAEAETAFFENDELNDDEDPAILYGGIPDFFGTVLNTFGEVITRDGSVSNQQIHVARKDGTNYTILNGDPGKAMTLRGEFTYDNEDPSIKIVDDRGGIPGGGSSVKCETSYEKTTTKYLDINGRQYRAQLRVGVLNYSFVFIKYHGALSELRSHKKKNNGNGWNRHRTRIDITQSGVLYNGGNCNVASPLTAASTGYYTSWKYHVEKIYPSKVSASNKGGTNIIQAAFDWEGQAYILRLF